jgi:exonuclease VII small subunit
MKTPFGTDERRLPHRALLFILNTINMVAKKETYSQAMERLEKIVRQIDNNELDIDILSEKIKEANEIIAFCTEKLTKVDREVEKLLQEKRQSEE